VGSGDVNSQIDQAIFFPKGERVLKEQVEQDNNNNNIHTHTHTHMKGLPLIN
jgi:hypothetical protein